MVGFDPPAPLIFGVVVALRVMLAVVDVWTSEVRLKSEMLLAGENFGDTPQWSY